MTLKLVLRILSGIEYLQAIPHWNSRQLNSKRSLVYIHQIPFTKENDLSTFKLLIKKLFRVKFQFIKFYF